MSIQRRFKKGKDRKQAARAVKQRLVVSIAFLIGILLAMIFGIGELWWPLWLVQHRTQVEGMIVLVLIVLILLAPIMTEASGNTRTLSGPGKNPYIDP